MPVKAFAEAKSRLAAVLSPADRERLSRQFLVGTLQMLSRVRQVAQVAVVSSDPIALELASSCGVHVWDERLWINEGAMPGDLNWALKAAAQQAEERGARALMIIPTDLPLAEPADLESVLALVGDDGGPPAVVVVPDRRGEGTNLLALRPTRAIPFLFGRGSLERHRRACLARRVPFHSFQKSGLMLDIDLPEDLELLRRSGAHSLGPWASTLLRGCAQFAPRYRTM